MVHQCRQHHHPAQPWPSKTPLLPAPWTGLHITSAWESKPWGPTTPRDVDLSYSTAPPPAARGQTWVGPGSSEVWHGYNNPTPTDGADLPSILLSNSFNGEKQTYEETNNATTLATIGKNKQGEFAWVVRPNGPLSATSYVFRMAGAHGVSLDTYTNYPQIQTARADLPSRPQRGWWQRPEMVRSHSTGMTTVSRTWQGTTSTGA